MNYNARRILLMKMSLFYSILSQAIFVLIISVFAASDKTISIQDLENLFIVCIVFTYLFVFIGKLNNKFLEKRFMCLEYSSIVILLNVFVAFFSVYDAGKNILG